jgi:hypothetical protein
VFLDCLLVEGIDHSHFGGAASGYNVRSDPLELLAGAPDAEDPLWLWLADSC